jgi:hypothetical protein
VNVSTLLLQFASGSKCYRMDGLSCVSVKEMTWDGMLCRNMITSYCGSSIFRVGIWAAEWLVLVIVCIVPECVAVCMREVMCRQYSILTVGLPRLCSCSMEMLFNVPAATSRKWQWGVT